MGEDRHQLLGQLVAGVGHGKQRLAAVVVLWHAVNRIIEVEPDIVGAENRHGQTIFAEAGGDGGSFVESPFAMEFDGQIAIAGTNGGHRSTGRHHQGA